MDTTNRTKTSIQGTSKRVEKILKAFQGLGRDDASFEDLFRDIESLYGALKKPEKEDLFKAIIKQIEASKNEIQPLVKAISACDQDDLRWPALLSQLRSPSFSPRLNLFRKISRSPGGLKFLLDFRGDLLAIWRHSEFDLAPLDADIVFIFEMWFQEGFLYLEEITFDSSYRQIELIKDRDLVHPMASIDEMGKRLGEDRRCFALYHHHLPYEPIVFIEVALTNGLVKNISEVMAGNRNEKKSIDTAIFYSINNTQNGLAGLGLGKMLIGMVVDYLRTENEKIRNFATLSPVPGFWKSYLKPLLEGKDENFSIKHGDVTSFFSKKSEGKILDRVKPDPGHFNGRLLAIMSDGAWVKDNELTKNLRSGLAKLIYHYIVNEQNLQGKPLNPVAGFHLGNGATVSARSINFLADPSEKGLKESCGFMVNYIYSSTWFSQVRRSFRWFDTIRIKEPDHHPHVR